MNVMIFGGRDFYNYPLLKEECDKFIKNNNVNNESITILSGKAKGADTLGEVYQMENNYTVKYFPAEWNNLDLNPCVIKYRNTGSSYNLLAGMNRNKIMVNEADIAIGFWDGKSKGTKDSINLCKKKGIPLLVVDYNEQP